MNAALNMSAAAGPTIFTYVEPRSEVSGEGHSGAHLASGGVDRCALQWLQRSSACQGRKLAPQAAYDWLCLSDLGILTLEVVLGRWAGDSVSSIAGRLAVSKSTVRRRLRAFVAWAHQAHGMSAS